ncbi:tRNA (N6-threonylcarbamoyladenosine(37)-N6)-methyltransferase TrmO [Pelagimonas sp. KU-00592-HH]
MGQAELTFIGEIRTPYVRLEDCPNNVQADGPECVLELDQAYAHGLVGLRPGQRVLVLYWFEGVDRNRISQSRGCRGGGAATGVFSLRSPHRPNPIAAAEVPILSIADGCLFVRGLDCLDRTKLLDIKPASR